MNVQMNNINSYVGIPSSSQQMPEGSSSDPVVESAPSSSYVTLESTFPRVGEVVIELAISYGGQPLSSNRVTVGWQDLWLNKSLASYFGDRITEDREGKELAALILQIKYLVLMEGFKTTSPEDQCLRLNSRERTIHESFNDTASYKGLLFFKMLEHHFGSERFSEFFNKLSEANRNTGFTTENFVAFMEEHLLEGKAELLRIKEWLYEPGIPDNVYLPASSLAVAINTVRQRLIEGCEDAEFVEATKGYGVDEWHYFILGLSGQPAELFRRIDSLVNLKEHINLIIRDKWLWTSINAGYYDVFPSIQRYIIDYPKLSNLKRYLAQLARIDTPESHAAARAIYEEGNVKFGSITKKILIKAMSGF